MTRNFASVLFLILCVARCALGDVVFENARLRAVLDGNAIWRSLVDRTTGKDYSAAQKTCFAAIQVNGKTCAANAAVMSEDRLVVAFANCDTRLVYAVNTSDDWIAFRLIEVLGMRPAHVTLVQIAVTIRDHAGSRLNAAWNDQCAICLRGINLQSEGSLSGRSDHTVLNVSAQDSPGPKLEGSGAVLIGAATKELKPILARVSTAFDLPRNEGNGVASKDLPLARQSYWFLGFGEKDVDTVIDYCRKTGFRQVMLNSGAWCASVGHFTFKESAYPDGIESLRRTVARLHEHGILVGMHTFASKVSKIDAYVTPVPSRGFWVDMSATLADGIGSKDTAIHTASDLSQWPGSPVCRQKVWEGHVSKHQEVILDDEIIRYESIGPEGRWDTFLGCQRGAWGTRAADHRTATECRHYAVDGCINGYILDQEAPLFQETTSRLAHIFNYCDFDMVYFDGSEDVDRRRYHYYSSNAHAVPLSKFKKRPVIHQGGGFTHGLWHSFTRSATVDQYPGTYLAHLHAGGSIDKWPTCKDHIDRSVRSVMACEEDMTPGELGWFGINPKRENYDGLQFDEIEYLMCKSLAYDAPISLQTSFANMEAHPLTPDILEIVRRYEELRASDTVSLAARGQSDQGEGIGDQARFAHSVPSATRERLKQQGQHFVMVPAALCANNAPVEFLAVSEMAKVAGTHDVRSFIGVHGKDTIATLWHFVGKDGKLLLDGVDIEAYDVRGRSVAVEKVGSKVAVPLGNRRLLVRFRGMSLPTARTSLANAALELRRPDVLWIQAEDFQECVGTMKRGSAIGITESEALGDVILCDGHVDRSGHTASYCEYRVLIPRKARWTLWARVRYPTGGDMSFGLVLPGERIVPSGTQVLGNCGVNEKRWHWTGRGGGVSTKPPGSPIVFDLENGEFIFRIYPREGSGIAATNPRLDCFCLAEDVNYRPTDADGGQPEPIRAR